MTYIDNNDASDNFWERFSEQPAENRLGFWDWMQLLIDSNQITLEEAQFRCDEFNQVTR